LPDISSTTIDSAFGKFSFNLFKISVSPSVVDDEAPNDSVVVVTQELSMRVSKYKSSNVHYMLSIELLNNCILKKIDVLPEDYLAIKLYIIVLNLGNLVFN
uniref:Uncharacterized protein n=1 Tax=Romanomermis culicivorax TaxID=13658 RepID=A0A915LCA3_ROMCU